MKKQKLIGTLTKSPKNSEMIKGPIFSLRTHQTKSIVEYFKAIDSWNEDIIDEGGLLLSNDVLFEKLQILPKIFRNDNFQYDFDAMGVDNYFEIYRKSKGIETEYALISYCRETNEKIYEVCLGFNSRECLVEKYNWISHENQHIIELDEKDIDIFTGRENVKDFYEFDFNLYKYRIEPINIGNFVFENSEKWWNVENLYFLPFEYINN